MKNCRLVITDFGGLQEETPSLGKLVLIFREVTERPEGVAAGCAQIIGTKEEDVFLRTCQLLDNTDAYSRMTGIPNPFGDGKASIRIVEALAAYPPKEPGNEKTHSLPHLGDVENLKESAVSLLRFPRMNQ